MSLLGCVFEVEWRTNARKPRFFWLRALYAGLLAVALANVSAPALAISFSDDRMLAPKRTVDVLFSEYFTRAPLTRWHFRPQDLGVKAIGHSGYFDPSVCPEGLWQATSRWLVDACRETPRAGRAPQGPPGVPTPVKPLTQPQPSQRSQP